MEIECIVKDDNDVLLEYKAENQIKWLKKNKAKILKTEKVNNEIIITYKI